MRTGTTTCVSCGVDIPDTEDACFDCWNREERRAEMIFLASMRYSLAHQFRRRTDYECISEQTSFYESVGSPELMPKLSP